MAIYCLATRAFPMKDKLLCLANRAMAQCPPPKDASGPTVYTGFNGIHECHPLCFSDTHLFSHFGYLTSLYPLKHVHVYRLNHTKLLNSSSTSTADVYQQYTN